MNICYLLESTELSGGVRVVFDQARALKKLGHNACVRASRGNHKWYPHQIEVDYVPDLSSDFSHGKPFPDVVIATFWTTVQPALKLAAGQKFHLCQGYEGDLPEYSQLLPEIEAAYKIPLPKITIGPWLSNRLKEVFGAGCFEIYTSGQIVDLDIFKPLPSGIRHILGGGSKEIRILIVGLYESTVKDIPTALKAVGMLRERGFKICLTRVSPCLPREREYDITCINEYHTNISPVKLAMIYQECDLFLAPSISGEGFGLPFAEALACGMPSVATAIPSHISFDSNPDYACFVPEKDPEAMADAAIHIIQDACLQGRLSKRGVEVVHNNFRAEAVAKKLESVFMGAGR